VQADAVHWWGGIHFTMRSVAGPLVVFQHGGWRRVQPQGILASPRFTDTFFRLSRSHQAYGPP
jgi:hypothetical protein